MAVRRSLSPTLRNQTYRSDRNILKDSTNYNFRIQTAPPLSLHQYTRSVATIPGTQQWQSTSVYRSLPYQLYLSPEAGKRSEIPVVQPWSYSYRRKYVIPTYTLKHYKDIKPKPPEPIWHPPSRYVDKRPRSLSPETKPQKITREPAWHPPGRYVHKRPKSLSPETKPQKIIREPVWHAPGRYTEKRPKRLSPETKPQKIIREPTWHPPGRYVHKRPKSLSPETKPQKIIREPVWHAPGRYIDKRPRSLSPERKPEKLIREPTWRPPGRYVDKRPQSLSPEKKPEKPIREPLWHPPGRYVDERPQSLSPEIKPQEVIREPVWRPAGPPQHRPVPYFDPPNLRWSLQQLRKSMPNLGTKTLRASRSTSVTRSQYMKDF